MQSNGKEEQWEELDREEGQEYFFPLFSQNIQFKVQYWYRKYIKKKTLCSFFLGISNVVKHTNVALQVSVFFLKCYSSK